MQVLDHVFQDAEVFEGERFHDQRFTFQPLMHPLIEEMIDRLDEQRIVVRHDVLLSQTRARSRLPDACDAA